ncbi:uncharacterized protein [Typha latifolia]|uniref:uncharacterized protein n=1 Tax=Typha latifolia TaxID=4733 RepID=UPI003C2F6C08
MSFFKRFDLPVPSYIYRESLLYSNPLPPFPAFSSCPFAFDLVDDDLLGLDLLNLKPNPLDLLLPSLEPPSPHDLFSPAAGLAAFRRSEAELCLRSLNDRVSALELGLNQKYQWTAEREGEKKYKWTAETKGLGERSLRWTAEIKGEKEDGFDRKYKWAAEKKGVGEGTVKWTTEIKGKGKNAPLAHTYTYQVSTPEVAREKEEGKVKKGKMEKKEKKEKKEKECPARVVEIEEKNPGAILVRKAFARNYLKGKRRELSPPEAALLIQMTFRAHLARRSQVLRCLRDLAIAKAKLKEIRAFFCNFSYRRRITRDAEERQKFSEKIIVLLLTVEALEGPDCMVRTAKRSMVDELEAMLEVVDPQPAGKLRFTKRRTFDLPDGGPISQDMMAGVAEVVQVIEQEH